MTSLGKTLIVLLVVNVTMRFFTTGIGIAPRILNVADLGIVAWMFMTRLAGQYGRGPLGPRPIVRKFAGFLVVCAIGAFLNWEFFFARAAFGQAGMMAAPIALFLVIASSRISERDFFEYDKVLRKLIYLEIGIGILQFPKFLATGISESLLGTFQHNAEQYQAFLVICILYFIGSACMNPRFKNKAIWYSLGVFFLIFCIDNKASWLGLGVTFAVIFDRIGVFGRGKHRLLKWAAGTAVIGAIAVFAISQISNTLYRFERLADIVASGDFFRLGKIKAYFDIGRSHTLHPTMMVVGAGPSTFYSRGCRQFFLSQSVRAKMYRNPDVEATGKTSSEFSIGRGTASDSMGGVISAIIETPYYDQFFDSTRQIVAVGSGQVDTPFSPYAGLLGESGLLGTFFYLSIYVYALKLLHGLFRREYYQQPWFPLLVATYGFCIYLLANSVWGPFIETTRYTTILWSFIGMIFHARRMTAEKAARQESQEMDSASQGTGTSDPEFQGVVG